MSELAVSTCTFKASLDEGVGTITALMSASPLTPPSPFVLADSKEVYFDKITVILATGSSVTVGSPPDEATSSTGTLVAPDTIDINGTASDVTSDGKNAVQKGDKGSKLVTFTFPSSGSGGVTGTYNVTVEVDNAGQSFVTAS